MKYKTANTEEHARLDVSARSVWIRGSRAFFDVKVFTSLAGTYSGQTLKAIYDFTILLNSFNNLLIFEPRFYVTRIVKKMNSI